MVAERIVIKFSGEVMGQAQSEANLDFDRISRLAQALKRLAKQGYQIAVVIGGGNIFRARMLKRGEISRVSADYMGMLATMINALALQAVLNKVGQKARVLAPFSWPAAWEDYSPSRAQKLLLKKTIVIMAGGTGKPYFSTDTALVLRAVEIGAKRIFKATNVAGVYSSDPDRNKSAKFYKKLTYQEALKKKLKIMDASAYALAAKSSLILRVFKYSPSNLERVLRGLDLGTKVIPASAPK